MKINEAALAVGITTKNIRFYEKEGLLHPARNLENGYRDYNEQDVEVLRRIKLLRKISIPLEEIRALQSGHLLLKDGLRRHLIALERESENLEQLQEFCKLLMSREERLDSLDAVRYLTEMEHMEREGMQFLNTKQTDQKKKRWIGALLAGGIMIALCIWFLAFMVWAFLQESPDELPAFFAVVILVFPLIALVCIVYALIQRRKEIQGGEEDAASKY